MHFEGAEIMTAGPMEWRFEEAVEQETNRSARYNHYSSVLLLGSPNVSARSLLRRVSSTVRASDMIGLVSEENGDRQAGDAAEGRAMVGLILPETDRGGCETVVERLRKILAPEEEVRIGMAVFPDDGTVTEDLLRTAASWDRIEGQ
jgi:hypothetical protein